MNILAIDPGTKTGWATLYKGQIESGTEDFSVQRGESKGMRHFRFNKWLTDEMLMVQFDLIVYEMSHHKSVEGKKVVYGMITRIEEICALRDIEYTNIPAPMLKKYSTGSGRASKEQMIEAARRKFPDQEIETDDQADALLILGWSREKFKK